MHVNSEEVFQSMFDVLKTVKWPDLDRDTVLNVWLLRARHWAPGRLAWEWKRLAVDAQGDDASESAMDAAVEQRLRQSLPRGVTGVSFRVDLRAGGVADRLFHGEIYAWEEDRSEVRTEAVNAALHAALAPVAWPALSRSTVLNFTVVREAPSVGRASLACDWPRVSADAQGDEAAESAALSDELAERLVATLPEDVSAVEFRIEISQEGKLEGPPFHLAVHQWRQISQRGVLGEAEA